MVVDIEDAWSQGLCPMVVFDANGMEIKRRIIEFDTETGRVEYIVEDSEGRVKLNEDDETCETATEFYPAPLIWRKVT